MKTKEEIKKMKKSEMEAYINELQKTVVKQSKTIYEFHGLLDKLVQSISDTVEKINQNQSK